MLRKFKSFLAVTLMSSASIVFADTTVQIYTTAAAGHGQDVGSVLVSETEYGLLFIPSLHGLSPGIHGFHIHVNPSCDQNGMAAGGHWDPKNTGKHLGPYNNNGHMGDLPALTVAADG